MNVRLDTLMNCFFSNHIQELEDKARKLLYSINIEKSTGNQLDRIGDIVNQSRLGYNDEYYRILLKVKIGINVSTGDIERIITLWKLLTNSANVALIESFPAKIKLETDQYLGDDIFNFLKSVSEAALAGGIRIDTILVVDPTRFGFGPTMGPFGSQWATSY